jgi:hypothetical protein
MTLLTNFAEPGRALGRAHEAGAPKHGGNPREDRFRVRELSISSIRTIVWRPDQMPTGYR